MTNGIPFDILVWMEINSWGRVPLPRTTCHILRGSRYGKSTSRHDFLSFVSSIDGAYFNDEERISVGWCGCAVLSYGNSQWILIG
jgi:hypothetical protein